MVISVIVVSTYHILSFVILNLVSGISYDFILLINIILHSVLMTIIYTSISYFVMKCIYNKFNVKQIK